jgi:hypothetical protein
MLDIPALLIALALTIGSGVAVLLIPTSDPVAVTIGGAALLALGVPWSLWRVSLARRELTNLNALYNGHVSVPAEPGATRDLPAAILRPDDATDAAHLNRILARRRTDWPTPDPALRRLTIASWLLAGIVLVSYAIVVAGVIALLVSTLSDPASPSTEPSDVTLSVWGGLALAVVFPAVTVSRIAAALRDAGLVDEAAQWDRGQVLLDAGALADDGSDLRLIHRGDSLQLVVRRAGFASRPRARHFAAARRGVASNRVTGLVAWLILGPVGVALATYASARG